MLEPIATLTATLYCHVMHAQLRFLAMQEIATFGKELIGESLPTFW